MNDRLSRWGPSVLIALAAIAVYANSVANGFALDDEFIVRLNTRVHDVTNLGAIWLRPYWPAYGTELGLWRPLAIYGYAVQWAIAPDAPWFFHTVNVLMHATASVLAFHLLRRVTGSVAGALVGGLLFAVHPVHTEVVANVVGQAELIAAITTFTACLVHVSRPEGTDVGWGRRIALVILFLLGVLAKESAIVLPALLVALDLAQGRVRVRAADAWRYTRSMGMPIFLFCAAAVAYFAVRIDVLGSIGGIDAAPSLPFLREEHRVLVAFRAWLEYVRLLVLPIDLANDYSPGVILPVEGWTPMVAVGAVTFLATAILAAATPWFPKHGLPAAWLLITALPTSNLLMPIGVVVAERLLYTPSLCVSLIAAWLTVAVADARVPARSRRLAAGFAVVVLVLMSVRTFIRNPDWDSTFSIFGALVRDYPESYRAQWHNASRMFSVGQYETGEEYMQLANRIWPNDPALLNELGFLAIGRMSYDSAAIHLERSRSFTPWLPRTQVLLAQAYVGAGRYEDAITTAKDAIGVGASPDLVFPLLAQAYEATGRLDEAIGAWRATLSHPLGEFWNYRARYARALAKSGRVREALAAADSTRAQVPAGDSASLAIVDALRAGIEAGCFDGGIVRADCADPVGAWGLLAPIVVNREIASNSQNATPALVVPAATGMGTTHATIDTTRD